MPGVPVAATCAALRTGVASPPVTASAVVAIPRRTAKPRMMMRAFMVFSSRAQYRGDTVAQFGQAGVQDVARALGRGDVVAVPDDRGVRVEPVGAAQPGAG